MTTTGLSHNLENKMNFMVKFIDAIEYLKNGQNKIKLSRGPLRMV